MVAVFCCCSLSLIITVVQGPEDSPKYSFWRSTNTLSHFFFFCSVNRWAGKEHPFSCPKRWKVGSNDTKGERIADTCTISVFHRAQLWLRIFLWSLMKKAYSCMIRTWSVTRRDFGASKHHSSQDFLQFLPPSLSPYSSLALSSSAKLSASFFKNQSNQCIFNMYNNIF